MQYSKNYNIRYYNCDTSLTASVYSIIRIFEDIAVHQSDDLGVGIEYYNTNKVGWMLTRWSVRIKKLPKFRDEIKVTTIPKAFSGFYANREYIIHDAHGEEIITANTLWIFVNLQTRRPIRISQEMFDKYDPSRADMKTFTKLKEIKSVDRTDYEKQFRVRLSEIDTNGHVNNSEYISWALEVMPLDLQKNYRLSSFSVNYLKETNVDDMITVKTKAEQVKNFKLTTTEIECNGTVTARIEFEWEKI